MKKRMGLIFLSVLLLTGCGGNQTQPTKVKEEKIEIVKIESNKPKIKESKVINVFKIYDRGYGEFTDTDKKMIDHTFNRFNHTEQTVYKDSLTFLLDVDYSKILVSAPDDDSSGIICVAGIMYNNTSNKIKNVKYEANLKLIVNGKEVILKNTFELKSPYYSYINPNEAINILMEFGTEDYVEMLSSISDIVDENTEVDLNNIEFFYKN